MITNRSLGSSRRVWIGASCAQILLVGPLAVGTTTLAGEVGGPGQLSGPSTVQGATTPRLVDSVDPFIGTGPSNSPNPVPGGAGGSTIPGPLAPFGMVQFSPDTDHASPSGYGYGGTRIEGFSLTHFNGAGCPNNEDLPILPILGTLPSGAGPGHGGGADHGDGTETGDGGRTGAGDGDGMGTGDGTLRSGSGATVPGTESTGAAVPSPGTNWTSYASGFSHAGESASPGYYRVLLDSGILVELTASARTGLARFTFPSGSPASVLVNTSRNATGEREGSLHIDGGLLTGTFTSGGFCGSQTTVPLWFAIEFDRTPSAFGTWYGDKVSGGSSRVDGTRTGGWVTFDAPAGPVLLMRVGISYVSLANALENLRSESPDWDFAAARARTEEQWEKVLGRVQVGSVTKGVAGSDARRSAESEAEAESGAESAPGAGSEPEPGAESAPGAGSEPEPGAESGTESDEARVKLYSALYHVFSNPNVFQDVNGEYRGFDGRIRRAEGFTNYQNYSGWDIIRSWTHLVSAIAPEAPDILRSMVQGGTEAGLLPFWTDRNVETQVMVGDPGTVNVANAHAMGVRGFDTGAALDLMVRSASDTTQTQRYGLGDWIRNHHYQGNAAVTLEYAMADFALSEYAQALGETKIAETYRPRSAYWKESWNAADGFIEPKGDSGDDVARIYEFQVFGPDAPDENLALGRPATASAVCNDRESADKAVNGTWNGGLADKWCDNSSAEKWLRVDLETPVKVDRFEIYHAAAGGETDEWNTRSFAVDVSMDGTNWTEVVSVVTNTEDMTVNGTEPVEARWVRLRLTHPEPAGEWGCQPFDPARGCGFVEGNGAQYLWMVPQDQGGLFALMGGPDAAVRRLDHLFLELNAGTSRPHFYIGNEPEHGTPWTYNFAQAAPKAQSVVRRIVDEEFHTGPGGLPGNDDLGATSAWLVWAYLGMYPVIPGTDILALHGPYFPRAVVQLANGNTLTIEGEGAGPGAPYVQSLSIDGVPTTRSWMRYAEIAHGATLRYRMGSRPNPDWGCGAEDIPPSYGLDPR